jgi:hypothetical protein
MIPTPLALAGAYLYSPDFLITPTSTKLTSAPPLFGTWLQIDFIRFRVGCMQSGKPAFWCKKIRLAVKKGKKAKDSN